jgi:hypothetical protein
VTTETQNAANFYLNTPGRRLWAYSDSRPSTGASETEASGVDMRQIPWAQYKMHIQRWFYWFVNRATKEDYFQDAVTWGTAQFFNNVLGETGNNATTNGSGILTYPGTDLYNPGDSYGVDGPFASLRLKEWRRGIQDVDYLSLASQIDPAATQAIINKVVPKVMWEFPTEYPTWWVGPLGWSEDPDDWEAARAQLAQIISGGH